MTYAVWLNGSLVDETTALVSVRDRGLTLGDGLFETIRVRDSRLRLWDRHEQRLREGAATIGIDLSWSAADLLEAVRETLRANALRDAAVRVTLTRGVAQARGLGVTPGGTPTLVVDAQPFTGYPPELWQRGMRVLTSHHVRAQNSPITRHKVLGCLDLVLARSEAAAAGLDEALLCNGSGRYVCASAANLFVVDERGGVHTPPLSEGPLAGVTRATILEGLLTDEPCPGVETPLDAEALFGAREAFLSSSLLGIAPVTEIDGRPVGGGQPGPVTAQLIVALEREEERTAVAVS